MSALGAFLFYIGGSYATYFLSEQDLSILDYGYATDEYEIVLDALAPQKSSFVIISKV